MHVTRVTTHVRRRLPSPRAEPCRRRRIVRMDIIIIVLALQLTVIIIIIILLLIYNTIHYNL